MGLLDIYVPAGSRTLESITLFRDAFLKGSNEAAGEYVFPQYADVHTWKGKSSDELFKLLLSNPNEPYSVYWNGSDPRDVHSGMMFFTNDGGLIAGLSVWEDKSDSYMEKLKRVMGANKAVVLYEQPPPDSMKEFLELCK